MIEVREQNGSLIVLQDGRSLNLNARLNLSAAELAVLVRDHRLAAFEAGSAVASQSAAQMLQQTADRAAQAGVEAGAKAGVQAGVQYALQNTRVRRVVERDKNGTVIGSVETREPLPPKPRRPIGFQPRAGVATENER